MLSKGVPARVLNIISKPVLGRQRGRRLAAWNRQAQEVQPTTSTVRLSHHGWLATCLEETRCWYQEGKIGTT